MTLEVFHDAEYIPREDWSAFVDGHRNGKIFHSPDYHDALMETLEREPKITFIKEKGEIVGLFAREVLRINKPGLRVLTKRSISYGGPLFLNQREDVLEALLCSDAEDEGVYTEIRCLDDFSGFQKVLNAQGFMFEPHLDILIDTSKTDDVWSGLKSKKRQQIRKGLKAGLTITCKQVITLAEMDACYRLLEDLYTRINLPYPQRAEFSSMCVSLMNADRTVWSIASIGSEIVGFRVGLLQGKMLYDWYAANAEGYSNLYINENASWASMKWASEHGVHVFDFGGAGHPDKSYGVRNFKMQFGGSIVNYGRYIKIHKPFIYKLGVLGINLLRRFSLVSKIIR